MKEYTILLLVLAVASIQASKHVLNPNAKEFKPKSQNQQSYPQIPTHILNPTAKEFQLPEHLKTPFLNKLSKGANLSANLLLFVGQFLPPKDLIYKMAGTCKNWSKVKWRLLYMNLTSTDDRIVVFKKIDEDKFFLEDPMNLLDPATNWLTRCVLERRSINFSTATWKDVFIYSMMGQYFFPEVRARTMAENSLTQFLKSLAKSAAENCLLGWEAGGFTPLSLAARTNEAEVAQILIQRDKTIVNDTRALELAVYYSNLEVVEILLQNISNIDANILESCAQHLQWYEERCRDGDELLRFQRLQQIKKKLIHQNENKNSRKK